MARGRGEGSVYFDKDRKIWRGSLVLGRDPITGKTIRVSRSAKNKNELLDKLDTLKHAKRTGEYQLKNDTTVAEIAEEWLDSADVQSNSRIS